MEFNLNSTLKIKNGSNIEEIADALQKFTEMYLYINEDLNLHAVNEIKEIPYGQCELMEVDNGFLLSEKGSERLLKVFDKEVMKSLTQKIEFTEFQGYFNGIDNSDNSDAQTSEDNSLTVDNSLEDNSLTTGSSRTDNSLTTGSSRTDNSLENSLLEDTLLEDSLLEDSSDCVVIYSKKEFENKLLKTYEDQVSLEACREISEVSPKTFHEEENPEIYQEEEKNYLVETFFRIFMRDIDDVDCKNAICINNKTFSYLEEENDIDLNETIAISFSSYLEKKGYNVEVKISFYEKLFGEVMIYSDKKIDESILDEIETNALLNVNDETVIFFILKCINEHEMNMDNEVNDTVENEQKMNNTVDNVVYSTQVPLSRLPKDFTKICIEKAKDIPEYDIEQFYYATSEIIIKNEGNGLFSIFDLDLYFYLPRLYPDEYDSSIINYNELPVGQFYL